MARFNLKRSRPKRTMNRAGGQAYVQSAKMQLASVLLTSFARDQYYRSGKETFAELIGLLAKVDPRFAAQAAVYARTAFGMRSIKCKLKRTLKGSPRMTSGHCRLAIIQPIGRTKGGI